MGAEAWIEREAEAFRRLIEETDDLVTVVDAEGCFLYVNATAERIFGVTPDACVGLPAWQFVHPDDLEHTRLRFGAWVAEPGFTSVTIENRQVSRGGEVHTMHWRVHPIYDGDGALQSFASIARDVTSRVDAELAQHHSEARLQALFGGMLDAIVTIDARGMVQEASDSVRDVLGWEPEELRGQNVKVLMPEPHHSDHDDYLERYGRTGETWILNTTREFEVLHKDGHAIDCELSVSRIEVPGEEEPLFCGSFRDVTDRKRSQRALAESERRFRAVFDQEYQYVGLLRPDGTLIEVNRTALDHTGVAREDAVGRPFWDTYWWSHSREGRERMRQAVGEAAEGRFVRFETTMLGQDGEERVVDFSMKPLRDVSGRVTLLISEGRDVTELRRAERRETSILRALATIGESASILAHEIKNPITAVNLALRAVAEELGEDHRVVLQELVERMQRLERRIRRTLHFTRPLELKLQDAPVGALLADAVSALQPEIELTEIALETAIEPDCPPAHCDAELMEEVVTNLLRNALEALDGTGRVRLSAAAAPGGVELRVEDDGPGIAESLTGTLFQPYVTTKAAGTGLGLPICRKIVEEHGGTIVAGPSELTGAAFRILLPAVGAEDYD